MGCTSCGTPDSERRITENSWLNENSYRLQHVNTAMACHLQLKCPWAFPAWPGLGTCPGPLSSGIMKPLTWRSSDNLSEIPLPQAHLILSSLQLSVHQLLSTGRAASSTHEIELNSNVPLHLESLGCVCTHYQNTAF